MGLESQIMKRMRKLTLLLSIILGLITIVLITNSSDFLVSVKFSAVCAAASHFCL